MEYYESLHEVSERLEVPKAKVALNFLRDYARSTKVPSVAFVGEFSSGKTSLIESLLRTMVGYISVLEATRVPVCFVYGESQHVYLVRKNKQFGIDEIRFSRLKEVTYNTSENIDWIMVTLPIEELKIMNLIDTPGLNAETDFTLEFCPTPIYAWCLPYGEPLSETQLTAVNELSVSDMYWLATKADLVDEDEIDEVEELVAETMQQTQFLDVKTVSATWMSADKEQSKKLWSALYEWTTRTSISGDEVDTFVSKVEYLVGESLLNKINQTYQSIDRQVHPIYTRHKAYLRKIESVKTEFDDVYNHFMWEWQNVVKETLLKQKKSSIADAYREMTKSYFMLFKAYNDFEVPVSERTFMEAGVTNLEKITSILDMQSLQEVTRRSLNDQHLSTRRSVRKMLSKIEQLLEEEEMLSHEDLVREWENSIARLDNKMEKILEAIQKIMERDYLCNVGKVKDNSELATENNPYPLDIIELNSSLMSQPGRDRNIILLERIEQQLLSLNHYDVERVEQILSDAPRQVWKLPNKEKVKTSPWRAVRHALQKLGRLKKMFRSESLLWENERHQAVKELHTMSSRINTVLHQFPKSNSEDDDWFEINDIAVEVVQDLQKTVNKAMESKVLHHKPILELKETPYIRLHTLKRQVLYKGFFIGLLKWVFILFVINMAGYFLTDSLLFTSPFLSPFITGTIMVILIVLTFIEQRHLERKRLYKK